MIKCFGPHHRHARGTSSLLLLAVFVVAGCATSRPTPEYFREIKALRPEGYGTTNYGLAAACAAGTCRQAQREYHERYMASRARYGVPVPPVFAPILPYAEAVAARVDNGEITTAQAEALIQEMRARLVAEAEKIRAAQAQVDAIYWSTFWSQQSRMPSMRPIQCTTTYIGRVATTNCY
jgi:hypothetical protein